MNGFELFDSMVSLRVDVCRQSTRFEPDEEFWSLFREPGEAGVIPSKRVPLTNPFETLDAALSAIDDTRGEKGDIIESADASPRHTDLHAIVSWVLGFIHQEWPDEKSHR